MLRLLLISTLVSGVRYCSTSMALQAVDFEVYGRVQGVFFRKYTKQQAEKLALRGWCKNTYNGTVLGHIQGPPDKVGTMMEWLQTKGSPSSHIDKTEFRNRKEIPDYTFQYFDIVRD